MRIIDWSSDVCSSDLGYAHAGIGQAEQGIDFGILPKVFLYLAAIARALFHGARLAAVLNLTALQIRSGLTKTALLCVFVDFGAAGRVAAAHHIYGGFLAAKDRKSAVEGRGVSARC